MKPFISTNKIYGITVSKADENFIDECKSSLDEPHTIVFLKDKDSEPEGVLLLNNILKAIKIDSSKLLLIDVGVNSSLRLRSLQRIFPSIRNVLIFDVSPTSIGLNVQLPIYMLKSIGSLNVLRSDALSTLQENEPLKRLLWSSLKTIYLP